MSEDPVVIGLTRTGRLVLLHHRHNDPESVAEDGRPICSACVIELLRKALESVASRPQAVHSGEVPS